MFRCGLADGYLISTLESQFNNQRIEQLFSDVKRDVLTSITPLGVASKLAEYDKVGGNVDTTHNVRKNIYATDEARESYDNRPEYDERLYHNKNDDYNKKKEAGNRAQEKGKLIDQSNGQLFETSSDGKVYKTLDHIKSAKHVHDDRAANLAGMDTTNLANIDENLQFINPKVNEAKGELTTKEYVANIDDRIKGKKKLISKLESKESLSTQQQKELDNAKKFVEKNEAIDKERMLKAGDDAQKAVDEKVDEAYYKSKKFKDNSINAAKNSAKNAGISAALSKVLSLFMSSLIDEVVDCWKNGKETDSIIKEFKVRIKRIIQKCIDEWKAIVGTGLGAAISGFFSEIATIFINTFATTSKRVVTLIREGGFSILRALKIFILPPEGLTRTEAAHEACKVFTGGLIMAAGTLAESAVDTFLKGILPIGSGLVSTIIVGALVAITSCLAAYLIDKADLLSVINSQKQNYVSNELDNLISSEIDRTNLLKKLL